MCLFTFRKKAVLLGELVTGKLAVGWLWPGFHPLRRIQALVWLQLGLPGGCHLLT